MQTTRVLDETIVHCSEGGKLTGRPCQDSLYNWRKKGVKRRGDRKIVTLEWCYLGGEPVTSVEAYERFQKRINGELPLAGEEPERNDNE
jgi:hypothetical protein